MCSFLLSISERGAHLNIQLEYTFIIKSLCVTVKNKNRMLSLPDLLFFWMAFASVIFSHCVIEHLRVGVLLRHMKQSFTNTSFEVFVEFKVCSTSQRTVNVYKDGTG